MLWWASPAQATLPCLSCKLSGQQETLQLASEYNPGTLDSLFFQEISLVDCEGEQRVILRKIAGNWPIWVPCCGDLMCIVQIDFQWKHHLSLFLFCWQHTEGMLRQGKRLQSLAYDHLHTQTHKHLLAEAASAGQLNCSMIIYLPFHTFLSSTLTIVPSPQGPSKFCFYESLFSLIKP